jgi:hypothetical protein
MPSQTYGLAHVEYQLGSGAVIGSIDTIALNGINTSTSLSDNNGGPISFTPINGLLSAVPESSALVQAATAALIGLAGFGWSRRWSVHR